MKGFKLFLFYYSVVIISILLFSSYFLIPKPQNISLVILLFPVAIFLWLNFTNPNLETLPKWTPKTASIIFFLSLFGIFAYFLALRLHPSLPTAGVNLDDLKQSLAQSNMDNTAFRNQVETEIGTLGTKIDNLGSRDLSVLGEATLTPSPTASPEASLGQITVKDANLTTVNVYQDSATDSAVVGTVQFGVTYPFYQKITDWYKISQGWVESRWFSENP